MAKLKSLNAQDDSDLPAHLRDAAMFKPPYWDDKEPLPAWIIESPDFNTPAYIRFYRKRRARRRFMDARSTFLAGLRARPAAVSVEEFLAAHGYGRNRLRLAEAERNGLQVR